MLLARDVKEELQNLRPLSREVILEMGDVGESFVPDLLPDERRWQLLPLQDFGMHAHDQDFLIVGTVEYPDAPALGQMSGAAPHEVVVEFLRCGLLE